MKNIKKYISGSNLIFLNLTPYFISIMGIYILPCTITGKGILTHSGIMVFVRVMVHRSIEVKSMKLKAARPFSRIKKEIIKNFGEVFELRYQRGYVIVKGDLHDYRTREKLYKIITSKSVGG